MIRIRAALAAFAAAALFAVPSAYAQAAPGSSRTASELPSDAELRLKQAIQGSFRVLPIQNGIILVPLARRVGVDNVELRDGTIAVNGTVATGAELRQRLGRDADPVIELSYLDPDARRRLLLPAERPATGRPAESEPITAQPTPPAEAGPELGRPGDEERDVRRISNARVRLGGSIQVDEDEEVKGAVVAIGGSVDVNGRVRDDVVSVGGGIRLGPRAVVHGTVTSVGGAIVRDANAVVHGDVNEIGFGWPNVRLRGLGPWAVHVEPWWGGTPWRTMRLFGTLVRMGLFALLAGLILVLAPRAVERVDLAVRSEPWKAALVGFFAQLIFVPVLVVTVVFLAISIIGIPLLGLVPFAILAFFVALFLGFTGTAAAVAHAVRGRFGSPAGTFALLLVGMLLIWGFTLVGRLVSLPGGPFAFMGGLLLLVGFLIEYAAWTIGLGGTILTRFGRSGRLYPPPVPPPPPVEP